MYNILDLLERHGISAKLVSTAKNREYHSPCPGCNPPGEDRFISWPDENSGAGGYLCRQCGKKGDAIQFLRDFDNMSFVEAKRFLGQPVDSNYRKPVRPPKTETRAWTPQQKGYPSDIIDLPCWLEHAEKFVDLCHRDLLASDITMDWLARRGIDRGQVEKFRLGLNRQQSFRPRSSWGMTGGTHPKTGQPLKFILPAGIVIPWYADDLLRRLRIRLATPDPQNPKKKYHVVVGGAMDTFITSCSALAYAAVETELDAIMIDGQAGDFCAGVGLGSVAAKPTVEAARAMLAADVVFNAVDFDEAGGRSSAWWRETFPNARRHPVPDGKDPGEAFELGVDIRQWLWLGMPASLRIDDNGMIMPRPPQKTTIQAETAEPMAAAPVETEPAGVSQPAMADKGPARQDAGRIRPQEVLDLACLLERCPVWIANDEDRLAVGEMPSFTRKQHWRTKMEISRLVFSGPVMDYLAAHPAKVITARNLLVGGELKCK